MYMNRKYILAEDIRNFQRHTRHLTQKYNQKFFVNHLQASYLIFAKKIAIAETIIM